RRDPAADDGGRQVEERRGARTGESERTPGVVEHRAGVGVAGPGGLRDLPGIVDRTPGALLEAPGDRRPGGQGLQVTGLPAGAAEVAHIGHARTRRGGFTEEEGVHVVLHPHRDAEALRQLRAERETRPVREQGGRGADGAALVVDDPRGAHPHRGDRDTGLGCEPRDETGRRIRHRRAADARGRRYATACEDDSEGVHDEGRDLRAPDVHPGQRQVGREACAGSSRVSGHRDALNQVLLQHDHEQGGGDHRDDGGGHLQVPAGAGEAGEARQTDGQRAVRVVVDGDDEGPEVAVPEREEGEDREHGDRGLRQRQDDLQERPDGTRAVDAGRLLQLVGDAAEELPHQERAEGAEREGQDERLIGVDPVEPLHDLEHRDDEHLGGHHQRGEEEDEHRVPALPPQAPERVSGRGRHHEHDQGAADRHDERVHDVRQERSVGEDVDEVAPADLGAHEGGRHREHLGVRLEGREERVDERRDEDERRDVDGDVREDQPGTGAGRCRRAAGPLALALTPRGGAGGPDEGL
ncbi:unnamed protein product, partial [Penicillium discolor]